MTHAPSAFHQGEVQRARVRLFADFRPSAARSLRGAYSASRFTMAAAQDPVPSIDPLTIDRRALLEFLGLGAAALALPGCRSNSPSRASASPFVAADGVPSWRPLATPSATGGAPQVAARYEVEDALALPAGFVAEPLALWGERFAGPEGEIEFGYNADFIGVVPIAGARDEFFVVVNHEYISARPWMQSYERVKGRKLPPVGVEHGDRAELVVSGWRSSTLSVDVRDRAAAPPERVKAALEELSHLALADLGVTVLHCRRRSDGGFEVLRSSRRHRRISGADARTPTHSNCSGTTTPWGTVLSCEENFQDYEQEFVGADGALLARETKPFRAVSPKPPFAEPLEFEGLGACLAAPHDGRDFGWVCHVDPASGELRKLRALGRFRHENVALRVEVGRPLEAYMGDDRRGGHVWKFTSRLSLERADDQRNVELLEDGVLCAARFDADGGGEWLALEPATPLAVPAPENVAGGHLWLPERRLGADGRALGGHVAVRSAQSKLEGLSAAEWVASVERFCGKPFERCTLGDLIAPPPGVALAGDALRAHQLNVLRLDAYAMANAIGATPSARPEDIELHPHDSSVFIACSDAVSTSKDGSPDVRVFPGARANDSRRYGVILRIEEAPGADGARRLRWSRWASSGELHEGGLGLACPDNLAFDAQGNLWVLTDMPGASTNAAVAREGSSAPGSDEFIGVFGSSALYMIPTRGERAGLAHCFAIGPAECELCGVTFSPDGETMFLAVQHPGEQHGVRGAHLPESVEREVRVVSARGELVTQRRSVPLGSNWPSQRPGDPPRPGVVCIRRV